MQILPGLTATLIGKAFLVNLYRARYMSKTWEPKPTIRTFLLPIGEAKKYALKVFNLGNSSSDKP